jgi:hypothetical protein
VETLARRTRRAAVTAVIGAASVTAALALATPPAQAAAAPHVTSRQAAVGRAVSPATLVWRYVTTFTSDSECEDVGLAEFESGEALDYKCVPTDTCPNGFNLFLLLNSSAPAAVPARLSAVQPAC